MFSLRDVCRAEPTSAVSTLVCYFCQHPPPPPGVWSDHQRNSALSQLTLFLKKISLAPRQKAENFKKFPHVLKLNFSLIFGVQRKTWNQKYLCRNPGVDILTEKVCAAKISHGKERNVEEPSQQWCWSTTGSQGSISSGLIWNERFFFSLPIRTETKAGRSCGPLIPGHFL